MKTKLLLAATILAANCTIANAQVLGGNVVGGAAGSLGGSLRGMHDIGAAGHGGASGAFGVGVDSGSLRRSASAATDRATQRTRSAVNTTHERTRSTARSARAASKEAIATTHDSAVAATDAATERVNAAGSDASVSGAIGKSASASMTRDNERLPLDAAADANASGDASASKEGVRASGTASSGGKIALGE